MAIEEFKEFLKDHPKLKEEVRSKTRTWQEIYDEWKLMPTDKDWDKYKETINESIKQIENNESIKNILDYAKKIRPDTINNTLGSIQKLLTTFQSISQSKTAKPKGLLNDDLFKNDFKRF